MMAKRKPIAKTLVPDFERDIKEWYIRERMPEVLDVLLIDRTIGKNIMWGTKDYESRGKGFCEWDEIKADLIANENDKVIVPRVCKSKDEQRRRVQEKGEVFTPAWVCNAMNNLVDNAWFERKNAGFNKEKTKGWKATLKPISFPKKLKKTWQDYVSEVRLEITCGEAPYLVSRYDMAASADYKGLIPVDERIGLLDRKLRIVTENCRDIITWVDWAKKAVQSVLGYDWQGDNVFIARENVLWTVLETVHHEFNGATLSPTAIKEFAEIISWNIWQMDGLKFVIPCTCHSTPIVREVPKVCQDDLFAVKEEPAKRKVKQLPLEAPCPGCAKKNPIDGAHLHNGIYCQVMNWETGEPEFFHELVGNREVK